MMDFITLNKKASKPLIKILDWVPAKEKHNLAKFRRPAIHHNIKKAEALPFRVLPRDIDMPCYSFTEKNEDGNFRIHYWYCRVALKNCK